MFQKERMTFQKEKMTFQKERMTFQKERMTLNHGIYRVSNMSAHVLLNLLNELGEVIKCEACRAFYHFFPMS